MTEYSRPTHFQDAMLEGAFLKMTHDHSFEVDEKHTIMIDRFEFSSPFGLFGRLVDRVFLKRYMRRFIERRNSILKRAAESDGWKKYLGRAD